MLKNSKMLRILLVMVCAFMLTGCGTELVELTEAERQQIINYSAHVVSEFNLRQDKGYIVLSAETLEALEDKDKDDTKPEDTEQDDDKQDEAGTNDADKDNKEDEDTSSLTEALGIAGIEAKILSFDIADNYSEGSASNVNAGAGNKLVVVRCLLTNTTEETVLCDIFNGEFEFYLDINDKANRASSLMTILSKDLTTMEEELTANESKEMVILFPVPNEVAEKIDSLKLIVKNASTNHTISMN